MRIACFLCAVTAAVSEWAYAADPIAYVSTYAQDSITTVNPVTGKVNKIANAGTNGLNLVVSPDESAAYVDSCAMSPEICSVEAIDLVSGKVSASIPSVQTGLALTGDGSLLFFVGPAGLTVVTTPTLSIAFQEPLSISCGYACGLALSPDGSRIYVAAATAGGTGGIEVLDARTYAEIGLFLPETIISGMAFSQDGTKLYLARLNSTTMVTVLDTASDTVIATVPNTGQGAIGGAATSPDGQTLYVSSGRGLVRIATSNNSLIDQIPSAPLSNQLAVSSDSQYVFLSREYGLPPGLLCFNVASGTFSNIPVGGAPVAEQAQISGDSVYVLQRSYGIAAEDTVTETAQPVGSASGTLTASSSGNVVAGLSQLSLPAAITAYVSVLNTTTNQITGQFTHSFPPGYGTALSLAISGDGTLGYFGFENALVGPAVSVLELQQGAVKSTFPLVGGGVQSLGISPDSSTLYSLMQAQFVVMGGEGEELCATSLANSTSTGCAVLALDSGQDQVLGNNTFTVTPDGTRAYVPTIQADNYIGSYYANFLSEVDLQSMTVRRATRLSTITSLDRTGPIAYSSATNSVYLILPADTGQAVVRVDLASFSVANSQYVNFTPTGMAVTPDGTEVLVTGSLGGTQILDGTTLAPKGSIAGGLQQSIVLAPQ